MSFSEEEFEKQIQHMGEKMLGGLFTSFAEAQGGKPPIVNTSNNTRVEVRIRTTQTAGDPVPDNLWKIVSLYDTGGIPKPLTVTNVAATTPQDTALTITFNAQDPTAGATVTFSIVSQPKNGTLSTITGNTVTYTPNSGYNGLDGFTFRATDGTLTSAIGTVSIAVGTVVNNKVLGNIVFYNYSNNITDQQVQTIMDAVKQQCDQDVAPIWGGTVTMQLLSKGTAPPVGAWQAGIFDNSTQPGAIGWHQVGRNGEPLIYLFVLTAKQAGVDFATVFSHEVLESIGDANANTIVQNCQDSNGRACVMFQENCDAVENNSYQVSGVNVSDFITPNWFKAGSSGPFDKLAATTQPFQLLSGGYMAVSYDGGRTWTEETKAAAEYGTFAAYRQRIGPYSRGILYRTPHHMRRKSSWY